MKRTLTLLLMIAAFAAALATTAQATGQRMHKPFIAARPAGYEPPDPCHFVPSGPRLSAAPIRQGHGFAFDCP